MNRVSDDDRSTLFSFLALGASQGYAPQSGEIIGILKQLMDEMTEDLAAALKEEEDRKANHARLIAAKKEELATLTATQSRWRASEIMELVAGEVVCNARTGVRRQHGWTCPQPSPSLCSRSSCLVMMKMKMRHTHTCHSQARVRANRDKRATWMETSLRSSVLSFESCNCRQVFLSLNLRRQLGLNGTTRMKTFLLSRGTMRQSSWRRIGGQP